MRTFNVLKVMAIFGLLFFMLDLNAQAQDIRTYSNNWGPNGMTLTRQSTTGIEVNFSVQKLYLEDVNVDGIYMKSAKIEGIFLPNNAGMPDLAGTGRFIAVPQGANVTYRIVSYKTDVIKNINIAPAPEIPWDNDPSPLKYPKNGNVYGKNANYPESPVKISDKLKIREMDAVMLGITPFQYNPVTKELTVYTDLKVEVNFVGGTGHFGNDAYRSRWFDPILEDAFINSSSLPKIDYGKRNVEWENIRAYGYEYIIICPNVPVFLQWADSIRNFRIAQGIKTGIFTLTQIGGNDATLIKNFLVNAWNNWPVKPVAALMLGDYNPPVTANAVTSPIYNNYCVSDNILGDVNNNQLPDIIMARMTAQDATQLQTMITKFLDYERNPPTNANYYLKPITALGWQTERWFQICSEVVGGYWKKKMGKLPTRINAIYSGTPSTTWSTATNTATVINYFGPAGTYYIPLTPDSLGGWSGGTAQMVVNAINGGSFALQHRDHGGETGWGEPAFQNSNIDQLTNNNNNLCFIFSINCLTGKYNYSSECFAEKFHRYKYNGINAGALGLIAASEVSYSFVNDTYVWGMMDNFWTDFMPTYGTTPPSRDFKPAFGNAAGKHFLYSSSWPYNTSNKEVTYHLFHHHSDAFLDIYANVPTNMTISHASTIATGVTTFNVTAEAGAFIALTIDTTILGTGTSTGSTLSITIPGTQVPPQIMKVVATKQDKYRYTANVQVIPNSGAYIVNDSVAINDPTPGGNNNHLMDYGETNLLTFRAKNVGSVSASNVVIKVTTTNPYITMTDSTENFGTIAPGGTVTINNAFAYNVSNLLPDNTSVSFNVTATSGTNTWTSAFSITGHSAKMVLGGNIITDSTGNNNGRLDPGESVKFKIAVRNAGSSQARNVSAKLTTTSSHITMIQDSTVYGNINASDSVRGTFQLSASPTTPVGTVAKFKLKMYNLSGALSAIDSFQVTIGQNWSIIGTGTVTSNYPYTTYWMDGRTQLLYTASEINAGRFTGYVSRIGFNVITVGGPAMNGFTVRMQNTTMTSLSSWVTTGWTTCYSGTYTVAGTGWQYIDMQTPLVYNGTSNLLIEVCYDNSSYTSYSPVYATSMSGMARGYYTDNSSGCTMTSGSNLSYRPNITLFFTTATGINNQTLGIPVKYDLKQNYPNPFNPVTKINYELPKDGYISLKIYDVLGREVRTLVNEVKTAGYYSVDFNASTLSSGVYFYKMESGAFSDIKRMVLIK